MKTKRRILIPLLLLLSFLSLVGVAIAVATLGTGVSLRKETVLKVPAKNATMRMGDDLSFARVEVRSDSIRLTTTAADFDLLSDSQIFASVRGKSLQSSNPTYQVTYDGASGILSFAPPAGEHTLTATVIGGDTTDPTVSVTSPSNGATVSGTVTISATASDNVGVTKVEFYYDSTNLISTDTTSPYSIPWNTTAVSNGTHTLLAKAYDAAGNVGTSSSVSVTVSNATGKIGDLNGDGKVDIFDLSILLTRWGSNDTTADLNHNGTVDIFDLSILLTHWGT
jgi:hypothetical protein